jgi:hypothetical protein
MRFSYVLAGWEGSAADSRIYDDARQTDFPIAPGLCYLADAGFPLCDSLLVPYHGVRYHLKEWGRSSQRYYLFSMEKLKKILKNIQTQKLTRIV